MLTTVLGLRLSPVHLFSRCSSGWLGTYYVHPPSLKLTEGIKGMRHDTRLFFHEVFNQLLMLFIFRLVDGQAMPRNAKLAKVTHSKYQKTKPMSLRTSVFLSFNWLLLAVIVCVHCVYVHVRHVWKLEDDSVELILFACIWASRIELRSPGLHGKHYLLSHLVSPTHTKTHTHVLMFYF